MIKLIILATILSIALLQGALGTSPKESPKIEPVSIFLSPIVYEVPVRAKVVAPEPLSENSIVNLITYESQKFGVSVRLALDLAMAESELNPTAKNSKTSAKGIYQIMDQTWIEECEGDVFSVRDNVTCAMDMLSRNMLRRWSLDRNICDMLLEKNHLESEDQCFLL